MPQQQACTCVCCKKKRTSFSLTFWLEHYLLRIKVGHAAPDTQVIQFQHLQKVRHSLICKTDRHPSGLILFSILISTESECKRVSADVPRVCFFRIFSFPCSAWERGFIRRSASRNWRGASVGCVPTRSVGTRVELNGDVLDVCHSRHCVVLLFYRRKLTEKKGGIVC